jgi:hypothetical protein
MAAPFRLDAQSGGLWHLQRRVTTSIGLPQFIVAGALNFGGPGAFPKGDMTLPASSPTP